MGEETIALIKELNAQKKIAGLKKEIAEFNRDAETARIATVKQSLPTSETTAPETEFKIEDEKGYIPKLLAYKALNKLADSISQAINELELDDKLPKFMIVDDMNFVGDDAQLLQVKDMLAYWKDKLSNQNKKFAGNFDTYSQIDVNTFSSEFIIPAITGILGTATDVAKFFQGSYSVKTHSFENTDGAFKARVANKIKTTGRKVYIWGFQHIIKSNINSDLTMCKELHNDLSIILTNEKAKGNPDAEITNLESICTEFEKFYNQITTVSADGHSALTKSIIRDQIETQGITHFVYFKVESAGGQSIKKRKVWISRIRYSGGCVVSYYIVNKLGELVASDTKIGLSSLKYKMNQKGEMTI